MKKGIVKSSFIPVRNSMSEGSEMVTELIFGEVYDIIEVYERWLKIRIEYDGEEGYIDSKYEIEYEGSPRIIVPDFRRLKLNDQNFILITPGSELNEEEWLMSESLLIHGKSPLTSAQPIEILNQFLHISYRWGGRSFFGIDCSGFTQIFFKILGVELPRNASQQFLHGKIIDSTEQANSYDLAYFGPSSDKITHVGVILPNNQIIHASGRVRIDSIDDEGVIHSDSGLYTHKLQGVRNYL